MALCYYPAVRSGGGGRCQGGVLPEVCTGHAEFRLALQTHERSLLSKELTRGKEFSHSNVFSLTRPFPRWESSFFHFLETKPREGPRVRTHGCQSNPKQAWALRENVSPYVPAAPPAARGGLGRAHRPGHPDVPAGFWPWRAQGLQGHRQPAQRAEGSGGERRAVPQVRPTYRPIGRGGGARRGGGRMMDGLSAGRGPSSRALASVNTTALRGSRHWAERAGCLHKRTRLGMFRFWRSVSVISLWEKGKRTMGKWRAKNLASLRTDVWQIIEPSEQALNLLFPSCKQFLSPICHLWEWSPIGYPKPIWYQTWTVAFSYLRQHEDHEK